MERRLGLLERTYLSGAKTIELLASQLFLYTCLLVIQVFFILILLFVVFKHPREGSICLLFLLLLSHGIAGLCFGLTLASLFYDEEMVLQMTLSSFFPILLMSGVIWPLEGQPEWLAVISRNTPLTFATNSFRAILNRSKTIQLSILHFKLSKFIFL
jgi:ABC-type multidrug transport system permease subunit